MIFSKSNLQIFDAGDSRYYSRKAILSSEEQYLATIGRSSEIGLITKQYVYEINNVISKYMSNHDDSEIKSIKLAVIAAIDTIQGNVNLETACNYPLKPVILNSASACALYTELTGYPINHRTQSFLTLNDTRRKLLVVCAYRRGLSKNKHKFFVSNYTQSAKLLMQLVTNSTKIARLQFVENYAADATNNTTQRGLTTAAIFFHGTGLNAKRLQLKHRTSTIQKMYELFCIQQIPSMLIDGPRLSGMGFTANIAKAFSYILQQQVENPALHEVILCGHSRGACEALAISNLLSMLLDIQQYSISDLSEQISMLCVTSTDTAHLINLMELARANHIKSKLPLNIKLIMIDPVLGNIPGLHEIGYQLCRDVIPCSTNKINLQTHMLVAIREARIMFDLHIPHMSTELQPIHISCHEATHGTIERYGTNLGINTNGGHSAFLRIADILGIALTHDLINNSNGILHKLIKSSPIKASIKLAHKWGIASKLFCPTRGYIQQLYYLSNLNNSKMDGTYSLLLH